jgi:hypothetical protein
MWFYFDLERKDFECWKNQFPKKSIYYNLLADLDSVLIEEQMRKGREKVCDFYQHLRYLIYLISSY